jgi:hypothetical protein
MAEPSPLVAELRRLWAEADLQIWALAWALDHRDAGTWPAHLRAGELPQA